jgi:2-phosphosulfolactate phosphatase
MKIETILTPAELPALAQRDLRATACVVFDVLRATSTFVTALHHGAQAIIPVSEIAEALERQNSAARIQKPELVLLGGERNGVRISANGIDFDLGNSPREYTPERVRGKTIVSTTTNGTRALRACAKAKIVLAASFLNLTATAEFLRNENEILLVCAGTGDGIADEDVLAAGALVELLVGRASPRAAWSCGVPAREDARPTVAGSSRSALENFQQAKSDLNAAIGRSTNGRRLLAIPELRADVAFCARRDIFPLVAKMSPDGALRRV